MNGRGRFLFWESIVLILFSAGLFSMLLFVTGNRQYLPLVAIYVLVMAMLNFVVRIQPFGKNAAAVEAEISKNLTLKFLSQVYMPVVVTDHEGKVLWSNSGAKELYTYPDGLREMNLSQLLSTNLAAILADTSTEGVAARQLADNAEATATDAIFRIKGYPLSTAKDTYYITFWNNKSEVMQALEKMTDQSMAVAYLMIDNLDELQQYVKDEYRYVAARVDEILKAWATSVNGVLKEYEKDRYLMLFEYRYLETMVANRFPVLDQIREIHAGDSNIPVTVSMGVAHFDDTLPKKEELARVALDTALQRGGDQVVFRDGKETYYFGGRTKTMQKRTKVRSRVVAEELSVLITNASNVIVMGHANADHDSIAAAVGVARLSLHRGTPVNICIRASNSNVTICRDSLGDAPEYENMFTEPAKAIDLVKSETLLVICDVNNVRTFEAPELYENIKNAVVIDHHRKTAEFPYEPMISYIDPSASSASELLAEILEHSLPTGALPEAEANLLLSGIQLDTNDFTRNAGIRTFAVAQYLRQEGGNPTQSKRLFRMSMEDYMREADFQSNVLLYREQIAVAIRRSLGDSAQDRIAGAKVADKLLGVTGVTAAFALVAIDDTVYISARSSGNINVQLILEHLKGGGHYDVAGAQIPDVSMDEAVRRLKRCIDGYLDKR